MAKVQLLLHYQSPLNDGFILNSNRRTDIFVSHISGKYAVIRYTKSSVNVKTVPTASDSDAL